MMTEEAVIKVVEKRESKHMNKNNHIKIKERRWKRPRGGPTCLPILFILWACNFEKKEEKKNEIDKKFEELFRKNLSFCWGWRAIY